MNSASSDCILVMVFADTCGACKNVKSKLPMIEAKLKADKVNYKIYNFTSTNDDYTRHDISPNWGNAIKWFPFICVINNQNNIIDVFNAKFNGSYWDYKKTDTKFPDGENLAAFYANAKKQMNSSTSGTVPAVIPVATVTTGNELRIPTTISATAPNVGLTSPLNQTTGFIPTSACKSGIKFRPRVV